MNPEHALELCVWSVSFSVLLMPDLTFKQKEPVQFKAFAQKPSLIRREPLFGKVKQTAKIEEWFSQCQKCYQSNDSVNLKPVLFLVGPPGVGKSFCLERAAAIHNVLVHEIDAYESTSSSLQDSITRGAKNREKCVVNKLEDISGFKTWCPEVMDMILKMVTTGKTIVPMIFEVTNEQAFRRQNVKGKEKSFFSLFSKEKFCEWVPFYPNSPWDSIKFCKHYFATMSEQRVASAHGDFRQLRIQMEWFSLVKKAELKPNKEKETFYSDIEVCEWLMKQEEPLQNINILTDFIDIHKLLEFGRNALMFLHGQKPFKPSYKPITTNIESTSNDKLFELLLKERKKQLLNQMQEDECSPHEILKAQESAELSGMMHMRSTGLWNSLILEIVSGELKKESETDLAVLVPKKQQKGLEKSMDSFSELSDTSSDFDVNPYFIEEEYLEAKALSLIDIMNPSLFHKKKVSYKDMLSFLQPLKVFVDQGPSVFLLKEKKIDVIKSKKRKRKN